MAILELDHTKRVLDKEFLAKWWIRSLSTLDWPRLGKCYMAILELDHTKRVLDPPLGHSRPTTWSL